MRTGNPTKYLMAAVCAAAVSFFAFTGSAFAATVHGADFCGSGSSLESGQIDVLNVDGSAGETVFLTVKAGSDILAKNLPYTIGDGASADDGMAYAGVATLDIDGLSLDALDGTYTIEAYGNRAGGDLLYQGAIYGVYADLPNGGPLLIGTRTANQEEAAGRTFSAPDTLYANGGTYRLAGQAGASAGALHFPYQAYDEAKTVDGVVKYVDATGNVVATTKIPGLAHGEQRKVSIPSVIAADNGDMYRTVFFRDSVTASNPGSTSFSVYCVKMSAAQQALAGFYVATIQMVDQDGRVIATDSVNVTGEFVYTAPSAIYKAEVVDASAGETAVVTYQIAQTPTIRLSAANDGVLNRERTITVSYAAQPLDPAQVEVTFNLIDGSKRVNEEGRVLQTMQATVTEDDPEAQPPSQIQANGTNYELAGDPSDYAFTLHSGAVPSVDVYYTPEGYTAPEPYDVVVNYVNYLTGQVVESHSYLSDADQNVRVTIDSPAEFSANGVDYVRLAGQENAIAHSYYSGISTYTVYYRDVNDELSSGVVINTIRVVYLPGAFTSSSQEGASTEAEGASSNDSSAGDVQQLQLNSGRTYNVMDGAEGNATLTNESGVDSNAERIEDNETPLASGFNRGGSSSAASSLAGLSGLAVPLGVAAGVIVVAAVAVLIIRRRHDEDERFEA